MNDRGSPSSPLRVLYVMHNAARGGAATSLLSLVAALPADEVTPLVLCPDGPMLPVLEAAGIPRRQIRGVPMFFSIAGAPLSGARLLTLLRSAWQLRHTGALTKAIREFRPDLVHLNDGGMVSAAWVARRAGVPVVMHVRCVADRQRPWFLRAWSAMVRRSVARVVAIDESVSRSIREVGPCAVVYNPLRSDQNAAAPSKDGARRDGPMRVVYLTGLIPYKGIWDMVECARRLKDRDDIEFVIAGENSRPAAFHRSLLGLASRALGLVNDTERELRAQLDRGDLGRHVRLTGHVENIDALLRDADVLVFPSHLNGVGRSVFEAGVLGIPSVVTLRDRVEDIIVHESTGLIVDEGDVDGLAAAVRRLADDPELRRELGANAREKYRRQFDADRVGREMLGVYRSVVAAPSTRHVVDPRAASVPADRERVARQTL